MEIWLCRKIGVPNNFYGFPKEMTNQFDDFGVPKLKIRTWAELEP